MIYCNITSKKSYPHIARGYDLSFVYKAKLCHLGMRMSLSLMRISGMKLQCRK